MSRVTIIPHINIQSDMAELPKAWPKFLQRIRDHLARDRFYPHERGPECIAKECTKCDMARELSKQTKYVRVLEVTPGGNGLEHDDDLREAQGHCHMHLYWYGPYLDQTLLAHWWGASLSEAYQESVPTVETVEHLEAIDDPKRVARLTPWLRTRRGKHSNQLKRLWRPVVDVRACKGSARDISTELAKYLVKDGERDPSGQLQYVDPEWFAHAYEALAKRRSISASRYFWLLDPPEPRSILCEDCGSIHVTTTIDELPDARGPPN